MIGPRALPALAALAILSVPATAAAHARSVSFSTWLADRDGILVRLDLSLLDRDSLANLAAPLPNPPLAARGEGASLLTTLLMASHADEPCVPVGPARELAAAPGRTLLEWRVRCPGPIDRIDAGRLLDAIAGHLHFARIHDRGAAATELVLGAGRRSAGTGGAPSTAGPVTAYLRLGVDHIVTGWDHLLFLLVLLLAAATLRDAAAAVTGFTLGHSITLALAALGTLQPDAAAVEALIALSIALLAVDNVWLAEGRRGPLLPALALAAVLGLAVAGGGPVPRLGLAGVALFAACSAALAARSGNPARWRTGAAALFGLVHGLAFARVLADFHLSGAAAVPPLLGFNLGVELGQLAAVALAWPLLAWIRRRGPVADLALVRLGSASALALATYWFLVRSHGG